MEAFESLSFGGTVLFGGMLFLAVFCIILVFRQWAWNCGYAVADTIVRELWNQYKQRNKDERQRYVRDLIATSLKQGGDQRDPNAVGVWVDGSQGKSIHGEYGINVFWYNGREGMGILNINVGVNYIEVLSTPAPCPTGFSRDYKESCEPEDVVCVVDDVRRFIAEANARHESYGG